MLSFNVKGLKRNQHYLAHLLSTTQPKIVLLQEIWLPHFEHRNLSNLFPEYSFTISTPDMLQNPEDLMVKPSHVWHSVAVGWRKDIGHCVSMLESTCDRLSGVKITLKDKSLILLSYYAPTAGKDDEFLESICDT